MQTGEILCGVCGRLHAVPLTSGEYECVEQGRRYALWFGTVRAVSSTGSEKEGRRRIRLSAWHDGQERTWEWTADFGNDIAADSNDEFALAVRGTRVMAFHNLTLDRFSVFATCWPPIVTRILWAAILWIALMIWLVSS